jgi:hypothetical protein
MRKERGMSIMKGTKPAILQMPSPLNRNKPSGGLSMGMRNNKNRRMK